MQQNENTTITNATASLLSTVEPINLVQVCESLGWMRAEGDYPKQKHFKVAIVHTLIEIAKKHNWHIIYDAGFFYIYNSAYWVAMEDAAVKRLLKDAAIKMSYRFSDK